MMTFLRRTDEISVNVLSITLFFNFLNSVVDDIYSGEIAVCFFSLHVKTLRRKSQLRAHRVRFSVWKFPRGIDKNLKGI